MTTKIRDNSLSILLLFFCCILFSCQSKLTPLQVSEMFWQGMQFKDIAKIKKYSLPDTLHDIDEIENLAQIKSITFGKIIIDSNDAKVETELMLELDNQSIQVPLKTYLKVENEVWRVNYKSTVSPLMINKGMAELFGDIQVLTEEFTKEIEESVEEFKEEALPEIQSKLEQAEQEIREKLPELKNMIDEFLQELEESIQESLPSEKDTKTQET